MPDTQLFLASTAHPDLTAAQAADLVRTPDAIGFSYSPRAATFIAYRDGRWVTADGTMETAVDFSDVFEVRCFTDAEEVRWVQLSGGRGTAHVRHESPDDAGPTVFGEPITELLWGQVNADRPTPDGWISTESARVGSVLVPLTDHAPESGKRLGIRVQEYSSTDDAGNVYISDVRYLGVEIAEVEGKNHG